MHTFAGDDGKVDLEELRLRLRKMGDRELQEYGQAARYMCSKQANGNNPPRDVFLIQLAEARAEWKRRQIVKGS
jgi:hypothetical protein